MIMGILFSKNQFDQQQRQQQHFNVNPRALRAMLQTTARWTNLGMQGSFRLPSDRHTCEVQIKAVTGFFSRAEAILLKPFSAPL